MFELVDGYFGPRVRGKLGAQRKAQDYIVQPMSDGRIMVQADTAIGTFDFRTRKGVLNIKGSTFIHLNALGAKPYEFPEEFVRLALEACPAQDSETTRGGVTIMNTVKLIGGSHD
jgi:hypothetical protein